MFLNKECLLKIRLEIKSSYGSYLATEVFYPERKILQRITRILNKRHKVL